MTNYLGYYQYYQPSDYLSIFFDCFYQIKEDCSIFFPKQHDVYPDGYPEIIINLGGPYHREDLVTGKKEVVPSGACVIIGQKIRSFRIFQEENCDIISLKLKPYGLYFLGGFSQSKILNKVVSANDFLGSEITDLVKAIKPKDEATRMLLIQEFFKERMKLFRYDNKSVRKIIDFVAASKGILKIESICDQFGVIPRTLENHFKSHVGLSPKEFCAIIQFNNFLVNSSTQERSFTEIALECGYYDQAHLIRRFKLYTNTTPSNYHKELNLLKGINLEILNRQLLQESLLKEGTIMNETLMNLANV